MFKEEEIVFSYTEKEAIEDGVLVDISKFSKLITNATSNLLISKGYMKEEEINIPNLKDLVLQCGLKISKDKGKDWFYKIKIEFPDGTKDFVFCAMNEKGRYTVMLPEDY